MYSEYLIKDVHWITLIWLALVAVESMVHWYIIEKKKRSPRHKLTPFYRLAFGGLFLWWYMSLGYVWYWASFAIIFTHLMFFPEILNKLRGKRLGYLDTPEDVEEDSFLDGIFSKIGAFPWLWIRIILTISAVGILFTQGKTPFEW